MSIRQKIREYLTTCDSPQWGSEIISAMHKIGARCRAQTIIGMVADGSLVKHDAASGPASYSLGKAPQKATLTEEQRRERQRAYEAVRSARKMAARRAAGIPARPPKKPKTGITVSTVQITGPRQSIEDFMAAGGSIERLPGLKPSNIYPPCRPGMAPGLRTAP